MIKCVVKYVKKDEMPKEEFNIDYSKQEEIKNALELAKWYCKENIPKVDGWSKEGLEKHLTKIESLLKEIGNSFVVGDFK